MGFGEFLHTLNMVFPYMHREQIALWNKLRHKMQNQNPYFKTGFIDELKESKEKGVYLKATEIVQKRFESGQMKKEDFFQIAQFSYFPHKLTG